MGWKLKTGPTVEPVTLTEVKLHLKLATVTADAEAYTDEDTLLTALIQAAREQAEKYTNRALINQTWEYYLDEFPDGDIPVHVSPLSSVTSITYIDSDGVTQTLATTVYQADTTVEPGKIFLKYGQLWPSTRTVPNAVVITYVSGYGSTAASVPASIRAAILLIIGHLYEHRENVTVGVTANDMPQGAYFLLDPYRVIEF